VSKPQIDQEGRKIDDHYESVVQRPEVVDIHQRNYSMGELMKKYRVSRRCAGGWLLGISSGGW
jgi:hypothetical protein